MTASIKNAISPNVRAVFSGETVLLAISALLLLSCLANATHWPELRPFQFCAMCDLLASLTFFILSTMEALKHPCHRRTVVAAILFLVATGLCVTGGHLVIQRVA